MPIPALALYAGAMGLGQLFGGLGQNKQRKNLKPSRYIPPALTESLTEANLAAGASKMPGQELEEEKARQATAQYLSNVSKTAGGANELQNLTGLAQASENKRMRDIGQRTLLWKDSQRAQRNAIRGQIANQQAENRRQYQAAKSALLGASNQNVFGGISNIVGGYLLGSENPFGFLSKKKVPGLYNSGGFGI